MMSTLACPQTGVRGNPMRSVVASRRRSSPYSCFAEYFSIEGAVMPIDGDSHAEPISVESETCVRLFKAACDEIRRGR